MSSCFIEKSDTTCFCADSALFGLTKPWLRQVPQAAEEVQLRCGRPASYTLRGQNVTLPFSLSREEMEEAFLALCAGSVYAHRETLRHGYLALRGGVRVGVAGRYVTEAGAVTGVTDISGLCLRLPHRCPGLGDELLDRWERLCTGVAENDALSREVQGESRVDKQCGGSPGGMLIVGPPGSGKTTLLRELSHRLSEQRRVAVVDTRGEICLPGVGRLLTAITDCPAGVGIEIAVRTLSPEVIVTDEIGREEVPGVLTCLRCGVPLFASAHGESLADLRARAGLCKVLQSGAFSLIAFVSRTRAGTRIRTEVLSCSA